MSSQMLSRVMGKEIKCDLSQLRDCLKEIELVRLGRIGKSFMIYRGGTYFVGKPAEDGLWN